MHVQRILHREGWTGDYAQLLRARRPRGRQHQGQQLLQRRERDGGMGGVGRRIEALEVEGPDWGQEADGGGGGQLQLWTAGWAAARVQGACY